MERKSTKIRLKYTLIFSDIIKKLFCIQIIIVILKNAHCTHNIHDLGTSSNVIYNLSLNLNYPVIENTDEPVRWRHANRRKISLDNKNRRSHQFNTDFDLHSNHRDNARVHKSRVISESGRTFETLDSSDLASDKRHKGDSSDSIASDKRDKSDSPDSITSEKRHKSDRASSVASDKRHKSSVLRDIKFLRKNLNKRTVNFMMTDQLVDGEVEKRILYNGITAKETSVGANRTGLKLRQLTDGRHLVQIIYTPSGDIYDCEYITQKKSVRNFLRTLRNELKQALQEENQRLFESSDGQVDDKNEAYLHVFKNVSFRIFQIQDGDALPADLDWLDYNSLRLQCLDKHSEMKDLLEMRENGNKITKVEAESSLTRQRRSFRENFIIPGTKWCGAGQLASRYSELGIEKKEDKCCRAHDTCPMNILPFRRKFGVFNARLYTVSHCRCDRRFRACLKLADTSVSNMVGKLFFNIVQTKCFVLKPSKVCMQRSWWGKCLKRGYTKQAHLRNNLPY